MMSSANCVVGSRPPVRALTEAAAAFVALEIGAFFCLILNLNFKKGDGGRRRWCLSD